MAYLLAIMFSIPFTVIAGHAGAPHVGHGARLRYLRDGPRRRFPPSIERLLMDAFDVMLAVDETPTNGWDFLLSLCSAALAVAFLWFLYKLLKD